MNKRHKLIKGGIFLLMFGILDGISFADYYGWHWRSNSLTEQLIESAHTAIVFLGWFLILSNINYNNPQTP